MTMESGTYMYEDLRYLGTGHWGIVHTRQNGKVSYSAFEILDYVAPFEEHAWLLDM